MLIAMAGYPPEMQRSWAISIFIALVISWPLLPLAFCHATIEFFTESHRIGMGFLQLPVVIFVLVIAWRRYICTAPSRRAKLVRCMGAYTLTNVITNFIFWGPQIFG